MKPFFSMVYYGCLQVVRARVAALFFAGGLVLVAFSVLLEEIAAGQNGRAIVALGLAGISLVTSVLAGVLPLILIRGQLDSRQAYILLTRPVGRPMFVVAYFIVTALVVVTGVFVFSLVLGGLSVFYEGEPFTTVVVLYSRQARTRAGCARPPRRAIQRGPRRALQVSPRPRAISMA